MCVQLELMGMWKDTESARYKQLTMLAAETSSSSRVSANDIHDTSQACVYLQSTEHDEDDRKSLKNISCDSSEVSKDAKQYEVAMENCHSNETVENFSTSADGPNSSNGTHEMQSTDGTTAFTASSGSENQGITFSVDKSEDNHTITTYSVSESEEDHGITYRIESKENWRITYGVGESEENQEITCNVSRFEEDCGITYSVGKSEEDHVITYSVGKFEEDCGITYSVGRSGDLLDKLDCGSCAVRSNDQELQKDTCDIVNDMSDVYLDQTNHCGEGNGQIDHTNHSDDHNGQPLSPVDHIALTEQPVEMVGQDLFDDTVSSCISDSQSLCLPDQIDQSTECSAEKVCHVDQVVMLTKLSDRSVTVGKPLDQIDQPDDQDDDQTSHSTHHSGQIDQLNDQDNDQTGHTTHRDGQIDQLNDQDNDQTGHATLRNGHAVCLLDKTGHSVDHVDGEKLCHVDQVVMLTKLPRRSITLVRPADQVVQLDGQD